jgi:uncharacterized protein
VQIEYDGGVTTGVEYGTPGDVGMLLAHGAGAGQDHPWMTVMATALADHDLYVITFNYRYTEEGKRSPDRLPRLLEVHRAAADAVASRCAAVVLAGKSMGGRVGSHLVGDERWPAQALVYFGYPLVAVGKSTPRPTDHLARIAVPQRFVSGTRDRLGPIDLIEEVVSGLPAASLRTVDEGDHSFKVPKSSGRTFESILGDVAADTAAWVAIATA